MTISEFYILFNDKELKIEFGREYDGNDPLLIEYFNASSQGLKWICENSTIVLFEPGQSIIGSPSPSFDGVVAIYPTSHSEYGAPNNAVVYSADGKIKLRLQMPPLISDTARKRAPYMRSDAPVDKHFENISWDVDKNNQRRMAMTIAFDREWWEKRILDPETGTFGECISSGMR
jgi:hypothetical protein